MKIIFLDFDGVMDTSYYDHVLHKEGKPSNDKYGTLFDPYCVQNLTIQGFIVSRFLETTKPCIVYRYAKLRKYTACNLMKIKCLQNGFS